MRHWTPKEKVRACEEILSQVAKGRSLRDVCSNGVDDLPSEAGFRKWCDSDADLSAQYAQARETRTDVIFEEILRIADTPVMGEKRKVLGNQEEGPECELGEDTITRVVEITYGDMIEHRRLQVDARKWMVGKMNPKKYGDKLDVNHAGVIAVTGVEVTFVAPRSDP